MKSDQQIIDLLINQDKSAIGLLYDRYSATLFGIVLRIVGNEELAEDVIQETFIKVWRNAGKYAAHKGTLFTWMLNIARNTAIDTRRTAHYKYSQAADFNGQNYLNNERYAESRNINEIGVKKIVDGLDEKYRIIIELVYFKGYTQQEVVEELKIPLGTVKSRVRIALRELRKVFQLSPVHFLLLALYLF